MRNFFFYCFVLAFFIFMTLRLCGVITWSWWWVTAPLWDYFTFVGFCAFCIIILSAIKTAKHGR